jgi:hypothetical protein
MLSEAKMKSGTGILLTFLSIAASAGPAAAQSSLSNLNYMRFNVATDGIVICSNDDSTTPCNGSVLAPGTNWTVNYYSQSSSQYGVLKGQSSISLSGDDSLGPYPTFASSGARGGYMDTLTIGGGSGAGTMLLNFTVTGTSTQTSGQSGRPQFELVPAPGGVLDYTDEVAYLVGTNGVATISFPFTFGVPTTNEIDFYALSQIYDWTAGASASANYADTAILSGIVIEDSTGTPLQQFTIQSASGAPYTATGVVTPVTIRIKPDVVVLPVNPNSKETVRVEIKSTESFDARTQINPSSLTFGSTGNENSLAFCDDRSGETDPYHPDDLVCHFYVEQAGLQAGKVTGILQGFTNQGYPILGQSQIFVVHWPFLGDPVL